MDTPLIEASWFATSASDRERFRRFRHALPEAVNDLVRRRNLTKMGSDFAVPVARNRDMLRIYRETLEREFPGQYVIFGHIGDAHLHVNVLPANNDEWKRASGLMTGFARQAVGLGGTVSAEHGLGKRKTSFARDSVHVGGNRKDEVGEKAAGSALAAWPRHVVRSLRGPIADRPQSTNLPCMLCLRPGAK